MKKDLALSPENILDYAGFDFEDFQINHKDSAKKIIKAMKNYAIYYHEQQIISMNFRDCKIPCKYKQAYSQKILLR